jgi:hypothetical protein
VLHLSALLSFIQPSKATPLSCTSGPKVNRKCIFLKGKKVFHDQLCLPLPSGSPISLALRKVKADISREDPVANVPMLGFQVKD